MKKIFVTCYENPDLDGFACAVAYAEFLNKNSQEAVPAIFGEPHDEVKYIMDTFHFEYPTHTPDVAHGSVVLVDSSTLGGLPHSVDPKKVIEIIDHRKASDTSVFPYAKAHIELVGSAATLVAEKFYHQNTKVSLQSATLLYGAILSNTLDFKARVTTQRDRDMAAWLNTQLRLPSTFVREMFIAKSNTAGDRLRQKMKSEFSSFDFLNTKLGIVQLEIIGAKILSTARGNEIIEILHILQEEHGLDTIFLSLIGLEEDCNIFITNDLNTQCLLHELLGVEFTNNIAMCPGFIMRKEIVPLLREKLDTA